MTRSTVEVRFPDGAVLYTLHNNTVNTFWRGLYRTVDEAWGPMYDAYKVRDWDEFDRLAYPEPVGEPEDVRVVLDPDWEFAEEYVGRATRNALVSVDREDD